MSKTPAEEDTLRRQAEAQLTAAAQPCPALPTDRLLHELQVHQIELEMQNEALRETQRALEESRDRYLGLYEFAPVGYLALSKIGIIEDINLTGASLLNEDRKKLRGQRLAHFVVSADRSRWHRYLSQLPQGDSAVCELALQRNDGRRVCVRVACDATGGFGSDQALRVTLSDITDLNQAMSELRVREDRLQLAQAAAGLGIFDDTLNGGEHMVDQRLREIWGFTALEAVSFSHIMAGIHPDDRATTQAAITRALNPDGSGHYAAQYRVINRKDGKERHVAANGQVFFSDGQPSRFVGTVRDISQQRQLEQEIQVRRNAMDLLARQQVAFQTAAAIAHELNQPLVSVSAYSEAALLMLRDGNQQADKLKRALEGASEQSLRAGRTLHELLDFLQEGEVPVEAIDLREVLDQSLALAATSGYGLFRPVLVVPHPLPPVLANRLQVQKVIVNLLNNSVDAMRSAGGHNNTITITLGRAPNDDMAQLSVQDQGPGIDPQAAKRVFEPFFTTKSSGVGLGLGISRALIEANGGQLWLDNQAGAGATFHFTLPFATPKTA